MYEFAVLQPFHGLDFQVMGSLSRTSIPTQFFSETS
jgi:hypothetical protein